MFSFQLYTIIRYLSVYLTCNHKRNEQEKIESKVKKDHNCCLFHYWPPSTTVLNLWQILSWNKSMMGIFVHCDFEELPEPSSQSKNASGKFKTSATCWSWPPQLAALKSSLSLLFKRMRRRPNRREDPMRRKTAAFSEMTVYSVNSLKLSVLYKDCTVSLSQFE